MFKINKSKESKLELEFIFFTLSCFDCPSFYLIKDDLITDEALLKKTKNSLYLKVNRFKIILEKYYLFCIYNNSKNKIQSYELLLVKNYLINFQLKNKILKNYKSSYLSQNKILYTFTTRYDNLTSENKSLEPLIALLYLEEYLKA